MGTTFSQGKKEEKVDPTCSDQQTSVLATEKVDLSKINVSSLPKYVEIDLNDSDDRTANISSNHKCTETETKDNDSTNMSAVTNVDIEYNTDVDLPAVTQKKFPLSDWSLEDIRKKAIELNAKLIVKPNKGKYWYVKGMWDDMEPGTIAGHNNSYEELKNNLVANVDRGYKKFSKSILLARSETHVVTTKINKCTRSRLKQFGDEEFNYYEHFIKYGEESDITPQGYAEFSIKKIGTLKYKKIGLTDEQTTKLQALIDNPSTVENDFKVLCQILSKDQLGYIGW